MLTLNHCVFLLILLLGNDEQALSEIPRPRGVAISKIALYPPGEHFTCFDGLKTVKYLQINDDFCDCADSSDEPGTSACSDGVFHCVNVGFRSNEIPSSRVNDGICDCCDGSDEYDSHIECGNECLELGKEERQREKSRKELLKKGGVIRDELSAEGKALKAERVTRFAELEKQKLEAEKIKNEKEHIKNKMEGLENEALQIYREIQAAEKQKDIEQENIENNKEAEESFFKYDSNSDGFVDITELQSRIIFDKDRNGLVSEEEAKFFLDENERVDKKTFITYSWSRIKPYQMLDSGIFIPPKDEPDINGDLSQNSDSEKELDTELENTNLNNQENHEEGEDDEGYEGEEEETGDGEVEEVNKNIPEYDPETEKLIESANAARNEYSESERTVREIDQEIKEISESLTRNYGKSEEFAPLDGECFNFEDREYIYKFCPFDKALQQPKSGGAETRLGSWDRWLDTTEINYDRMLYNNGAACWNGPQRSTQVTVECGLVSKITAVSEPNRCEYHFVFETPAACNSENYQNVSYHDEL